MATQLDVQSGLPAIPGLEVLEPLGHGTFSSVYLARANGRHYALKILDDDRAKQHPEWLREARLRAAWLARITHPGLPRIVTVGQADGLPYLLSEFVEGESLAERIARGPLAEAEVVAIASGMGNILAELHDHGLIHRDVKPENIMVGGGRTKLVDFDMLTRDAAEPTTAAGTIRYAAPEVFGLSQRRVDARSDLYSLGAVLFECAAGRPPFAAEDAAELVKQHATGPAPRLDEAKPGASPGLAAIVGKLLAKDPDERYQTARGLLADLELLPTLNTLLQEQRHIALGSGDHQPPPRAPRHVAGRAEELAELAGHWRDALDQRGRMVIVAGGSGSGKGAMLDRFAVDPGRPRGLTLTARCRESQAMPFAALREAIEDWLQEVSREPLARQESDRQRLRVAAGEFASRLAMLTPRIPDTCGAPVDDRVALRADRFEDAVADFLVRLAGCFGGLLLVMHNVQWLDDSTFNILEPLTRRLPEAPLMVLASVSAHGRSQKRAQEFQRRMRPSQPVIMRLGPLRADGIEEVLADELGHGTISPELVKHLQHWTDGQPLALREYLQALLEAGVLRLEWGCWSIDSAEAQDLQLPHDVQRLVGKRVDGLTQDSLEILRLAALMGEHIDVELLDAAANDNAVVQRALNAAHAADLIHPADGGGFDFYQGGVRGALTSALSQTELVNLHSRIARTLEGQHDPTDNQIFALARHYGLAQPAVDPRRVYETNLAAGLRAVETFANAEAYDFLLRARQAAFANSQPSEPELDDALGEVCARLGSWDDALTYLGAALDHTVDAGARSRLRARKARVHLANLDTAHAWEEVDQAFHELGTPLGNGRIGRAVYAAWSWAIGLLALRSGFLYGVIQGKRRQRLEQLSELYVIGTYAAYLLQDRLRFVEMVVRQLYVGHMLGDSIPMASALTSYAIVQALAGRSKAALRYSTRSIQIVDRLGDRFQMARMRMFRAFQEHVGGDPPSGEKMMRACLLTDGTWLDAADFAYGHIDLAWNLMMRGYCREALTALEPAIERAIPGSGESFNLQVKAAALRAVLGRHAEAVETFDQLADAALQSASFWPRQNYLDHLLLAQFERGEDADSMDDTLLQLAALGTGERGATLHTKHMFVYQAHIRAAQCAAAPNDEGARGRLRLALRQLRRAGKHPTLRCQYFALAAAAERLDGNVRTAIKLLQRAELQAHRADSPWGLFEMHRQMAHCLTALDNREAATREARAAHRLAVEHGWVNRARWMRAEFEMLRPPPSAFATSIPATPALAEPSSNDERHIQRYLDAILEVSLAASSSLDPQQQARLTLDEVIRILNADRGFLFTCDTNGEPVFTAGRTAEGADVAAVSNYSHSVVVRVLTSGQPMVLTGSAEGDVMTTDSIMVHELRSIIAAPLLRGERLLGVLYVDSQLEHEVLGDDQLKVLSALASHAAIALDTAAAVAEQHEMGRANADLLEALQQRVGELQQSQARITAAEERLRKNIAEMLHSRVQSKLLVAGHQLTMLNESLDIATDETRSAIAEVVGQLDDIREQEIRLASHLLHPSIIRVGLVPALRSLIGRFEDFFRVAIEVEPDVLTLDSVVDNKLPEGLRLTLYRVVEEALSNAQRHARARLVEIKLLVNGEGHIEVRVQDDGKGFDPAKLEQGLGLSSIAGRVSQEGGDWRIDGRPGEGTTVIVSLPIDAGESELS